MKKFLKKGVGIVLVLGYLIGYLTGSSFWVYESIYICYGAIDLSYLQHLQYISENKASNH
jgi:hypothetical protein